MILVDSSVWIDFFRGVPTPATDMLDHLLSTERIGVGDLILAEVLQGFRAQADFDKARRSLLLLDVVDVGGQEIAVQAARNFRLLRERGITVRKTIDTLIATQCLADGLALLYSNRDFDAFVEHLGLAPAIPI